MNKDAILTSWQIADHYGMDNQLGICQEECAELIQAISKYKRNTDDFAVHQITGEIADVMIMISQVMHLVGISSESLNIEIGIKLRRQLERIAKEGKT